MVTEVFTRKYCDPHAVNGEKVEATEAIQFAWDERGRLFVACSPTYPHLTPGAKSGDYILILEDTDGDGRADKSQRFAEGLTMVQGVEVGDGGLYVCDFTEIVHLRDADGDGVAETQDVFMEGLNQPFGMAALGSDFYVGNTDGVMVFPYAEGADRITAPRLLRQRGGRLLIDARRRARCAAHRARLVRTSLRTGGSCLAGLGKTD